MPLRNNFFFLLDSSGPLASIVTIINVNDRGELFHEALLAFVYNYDSAIEEISVD